MLVNEVMEMTSCQQSHELIDQCVTGAIAPADALALERHLAGCPLCARRLRWHQCITDELANQARVPDVDCSRDQY